MRGNQIFISPTGQKNPKVFHLNPVRLSKQQYSPRNHFHMLFSNLLSSFFETLPQIFYSVSIYSSGDLVNSVFIWWGLSKMFKFDFCQHLSFAKDGRIDNNVLLQFFPSPSSFFLISLFLLS